jgi:hypothetical protein
MNIATASFADIVAHSRRLAEQDPKPLTAPGMFRLAAEWANQYDDDTFEQRIALMLIDAVTPHLDSGTTADWWSDLRHAIEREEEAKASGPRMDEEDIDWDERVDEALRVLAGQR